ncbi:hypothetical protein VE03_04677 [Pseudogymnoascus sp. 23342-1-I1]|nr:hypothetical protein VE03_04677 [Pseudogymnoascus sp. 23342-1-I1]
MSHSHSHEGAGAGHSHDPVQAALDHGHTHEILDGPGSYMGREMPIIEGRNWEERAYTVGIGGPVGSGKTALMLALCLALREKYNLAAVTNDIFTREDAEFLTHQKALPASRIRAIETGGCPHAAVREDISANLAALEDLQREFHADILLIESGGDNLAANYSRELADFIVYVIDVSGGDKIPRKGGPGITQSDLLVVNKTDLAEIIGADLDVMERDARKMREGGPTIFAQVKGGKGVDHIVNLILSGWKASGAEAVSRARGGPVATADLANRKHSSTNVPTLSTPFDSLPTSPVERSRELKRVRSASPGGERERSSPFKEGPPAAPFRGGSEERGTPLCTILEGRRLNVSGRDWLMGKPEEVEGGEGGEEVEMVNGGSIKDVKTVKDVTTLKKDSAKDDVKTATGQEKPRKQESQKKDAGPVVDYTHEWMLPSAGVGEWCVAGVIRVDPSIEEAMRTTRPSYKTDPVSTRFLTRAGREAREARDRLEREGESEMARETREMLERLDRERARWREGGEVGGERVGESWWRGARRRVSRLRGRGEGSVGSSPEGNASAETLEEVPEEANEYTPSGATSPEMIAEAQAQARAAAARAAEAELKIAPETTPEAAPGPAPKEVLKHISAAEKARAAVENEPHSPGWNGSTYIDGREHHYCGPDFPCQMEPPCNPSIRDLWDKGVPVTPDEAPPKRTPFSVPVRALLGGKKQPWPPEPKYRKPACVQSIRVGNTADTTIIDEPESGCNLGSFAVEEDRVVTPNERGEPERAEGTTMRRLRKFWGFWTYYGGKVGGSRRVIVAKSEESVVVTERVEPDEDITASRAAANLAASACYPVGESTVETAKPIERVDSGIQTPEGNEGAEKINAGTAVKK